MTNEQKELLLKDLCARLPYGVKAITKTHKGENVGKIISISTKNNIILGELYNGEECFWLDYGSFTPYLRTMSSMTDEERGEFRKVGGVMSYNPQKDAWAISAFAPEAYDWLNEHHFDYRGLIGKGLAIEAPKGMYNF